MDNSDTLHYQQKYERKPGVIATDLGNELILLDPDTGSMFTLNRSGRTLWQALPCTSAEVVKAVMETFEVTSQEAAQDVHELLMDLAHENLVHAPDA